MPQELRLPAGPVREILRRSGCRVTPDAVDTARSLLEDALERVARRAANEVERSGRKTIDGDTLATHWRSP